MANNLILHLKTGQTIEGRLARSIDARDSDIEIYVEDKRVKLIFAFDELCV